ncbi:hypothetical protein [Polyangium sorediatum]|uniref:Trigger factor C-terminal domain-containing protein n=1 Tax=Polyangium sorediatum TaxID=889274 RepID=A0ABT6P820_9BACT|nr:hypothetical protein [Polyangium sorediatum]MDI1436310.1 hypothetical protein [Polyangium sorediatum]
MHDHRREGPEGQGERQGEGHCEGRRPEGRRSEGPKGTEFLDIEISKVLSSEAAALTREAAREILKDAINERLRARLGSRLEAIARIAADELADDIEANLAIESIVEARKHARAAREEEIRKALAPTPGHTKE